MGLNCPLAAQWLRCYGSLVILGRFFSFKRNYASGYLTKNYETILVFAWFKDNK